MSKKTGLNYHENSTIVGQNDEWLTPPELIRSLGSFTLDPCAPINRPWPTAAKHYTIEDDGLFLPWEGRVWLNPPYGKELSAWLNKMALHGNGIALTFARTETRAFSEYVFKHATSILFMFGRLKFHRVDGSIGKEPAGAPSVLIAYGEENSEAIDNSRIRGKHLPVNSMPIVIVGVSPSWKSVVSITMGRLNGQAHLSAIYETIELVAPDKIQVNSHYKEKIRQVLQQHFTRVGRGIYQKPETN